MDLPEPKRLVKEFWDQVNDPNKASVNILTNKHVRIGGIPSIFYTWAQQGWSEPTIAQTFEPNRIQLTLPLIKSANKKALIKGCQ